MKYPHKTHRRARRLMPVLAAAAASVALAACGSSSTSTTSSATGAASASSARGSTNRTAFIQCLKSHGIAPPPGAGSGGTHTGPPAGGFGSGANSSARRAALKACGATGHFPGGRTATTTK